MKNTLKRLLNGQTENHILPFLWMHGEEEKTLREYVNAIHNCGIGAVCLESRPHPDFCGPLWWRDVDIILDECKKLDMKIWILDDSHFPTGNANGILKNADADRCKLYLTKGCADFSGPTPEMTIDVADLIRPKQDPFAAMNPFAMGEKSRIYNDDHLLRVFAYQIHGQEQDLDTMQDLTDQIVDGKLIWSVPAGRWRVLAVYTTRDGGGRSHYINMCDENSCYAQIEAVYIPHWEHYSDEFGKTILGFFSDEPCFDNVLGFDFDEIIGRKQMPLPWSEAVADLLKESLGTDYLKAAPAWWGETTDGAQCAKYRYAYMDAATRAMQKAFSQQIGSWCQEHGVRYIGHIIEDNNQHARLGSSMGHFFRGLSGQHMSGIDDIGGQVQLCGEEILKGGMSTFGCGDGEFYHYVLGKLGSSLAQIDPKKQGNTMCEIFGAYGWDEGTRLMQYLTNHFLVRGINYYVPHAFSAKDFPDPDCPPHYYAHGLSPLYQPFGKLMRYMNRLCNLISQGETVVPAAILYHGESEWAGKTMMMQKPARVLAENQIDFEILPDDVFSAPDTFGTKLTDRLEVNGKSYGALIIAEADYIPLATAKLAVEAQHTGFPVFFIGQHPKGICNPDGTEDMLLHQLRSCQVVSLESLVQELRTQGVFEITATPAASYLRYLHYRKNGGDLLLLNNESTSEVYSGTILVPFGGKPVLYDAMENTLRQADYRETDQGIHLHVTIEPYQMLAVVFDAPDAALSAAPVCHGEEAVVTGPWTVSKALASRQPVFEEAETVKELHSIQDPGFSGIIRYETTMECSGCGRSTLELEDCYEAAEVWVNDAYAGMKIAPPYRFDTTGLMQSGQNHIRIEVRTTLSRYASTFDTLGPGGFPGAKSSNLYPMGIIGKVKLISKA